VLRLAPWNPPCSGFGLANARNCRQFAFSEILPGYGKLPVK
jgi:hypothetical protein